MNLTGRAIASKTKKNPISLGTKTKWGTVEMVGLIEGERYYWMVDKLKCVSMMPAIMVEEDADKAAKA